MKRPDAEVDALVVGAGVVGLAIAAELGRRGKRTVVVDPHEGPGRETSSRNSGVVHAGIYYPEGSLKALCCVEGREALYARCRARGIPFRKVGKVIVATREPDLAELEALHRRGRANGAGDLALLTPAELRRREPRVFGRGALYSPETGIVDVHALCESYLYEARASDRVDVAFETRFCGASPCGDGFVVDTAGPEGDRFSLFAAHVINAAGLFADRVAEAFGVEVERRGLRIHPCKGDYFSIHRRLGKLSHGLVYPVPAGAGLGIHITVDLAGGYRAGPDAEYIDDIDYAVDETKAARFADAISRYVEGVSEADLSPDYSGIRPKLAGPGAGFRDFVLLEEPAGVIHLVGIESPGLTSAAALARRAVSVAWARG